MDSRDRLVGREDTEEPCVCTGKCPACARAPHKRDLSVQAGRPWTEPLRVPRVTTAPKWRSVWQ